MALLNVEIQMPELRQGFAVAHGSKRCVHSVPVHVGGQRHETALTPLKTQVPPFWQSVVEHGPMKFSQRSPVKFVGQLHVYMYRGSSETQTPLFTHGVDRHGLSCVKH